MADEMYKSYVSFKSWGGDPDDSHDHFFAMETSSLKLSPGARIIEVGFGEGRFLDFARRAGYDVIGIEIIPDLVNQAAARGHSVRLGQLSDLSGQAESFDVIVALDVIEHLTTDELKTFLSDALLLLKVGGVVLLRFPNGDSPFSLPLYNGDVTHRSYLNGNSLAQLADPIGLRTVRVGNASRDLPRGFTPRLRRRVSYLMRSTIETIFGLAYFGKRVPMDANLVAVLTKQSLRHSSVET